MTVKSRIERLRQALSKKRGDLPPNVYIDWQGGRGYTDDDIPPEVSTDCIVIWADDYFGGGDENRL